MKLVTRPAKLLANFYVVTARACISFTQKDMKRNCDSYHICATYDIDFNPLKPELV
jgi:hypothetical protein